MNLRWSSLVVEVLRNSRGKRPCLLRQIITEEIDGEHSIVYRMLLGSVSNYLVQKSSSPVMVCFRFPLPFPVTRSDSHPRSYRSHVDHSDSPALSIDERSNLSIVLLELPPSQTQQSKKNLMLKQSINLKNMQKVKERRTIRSKSRRGIGMTITNRIRARANGRLIVSTSCLLVWTCFASSVLFLPPSLLQHVETSSN